MTRKQKGIEYIDGIVEYLNLDTISFQQTYAKESDTHRPFHYDVEYYDMRDSLAFGSPLDEINGQEPYTERKVSGYWGLFQLAVKASGGSTVFEVKDLYQNHIIKNMQSRKVTNGSYVSYELIITGFNQTDALKYILKNQCRQNLGIKTIEKVYEDNKERKVIYDKSFEDYPSAAKRAIDYVVSETEKLKSMVSDLNLDRNKSVVKKSGPSLRKIQENLNAISRYLDITLDKAEKWEITLKQWDELVKEDPAKAEEVKRQKIAWIKFKKEHPEKAQELIEQSKRRREQMEAQRQENNSNNSNNSEEEEEL